jgi:nicotinamidase-related amidase
MRFSSANTLLLVLDVQGKLASLMFERERLFSNLRTLIQGAKILEFPILCTEQYPAGLGPTVPEVADLLTNVKPVAKQSFSCCGDEEFMRRLEAEGRRQVLIAGIEAHVCVCQTILDLLEKGYEVQVVTDAVASRTRENKELAIRRMERAGAVATGTEMALYELLRTGEGPKFKEILKLVR